eukprot:Awhi_evm1s13311
MDTLKKLSPLLPLVVCGIVVITISTCVILSIVNDVYIGGISVPFISDTGRDKPQYYIFVVGLTLAGILLIPTSVLHLLHFKKEFQPLETRK